MSSEIVMRILDIYSVAYSVAGFLNIFRYTRVKDGRGTKLKNGPQLDFSRVPSNDYTRDSITPSERTAVLISTVTIRCSIKRVSLGVCSVYKNNIVNESQFIQLPYLPHRILYSTLGKCSSAFLINNAFLWGNRGTPAIMYSDTKIN